MQKTNHARLLLCHANAKGTGCAMWLELHPAHGGTEGSLHLALAAQRTVCDRRTAPITPPSFD